MAAAAGAATTESKSGEDGGQQERRRKWRSSLIRVKQSLVFQTHTRNESLKRQSDEVDVVLRRQVPRYLQWALRSGYFSESWSENRACAHDVSGVMVFVDLKNYTKLTEMLAARRSGSATDKLILGTGVQDGSSDASEAANQVLNQYWELVISLVHRFQGDVVKFLGDGLQIMLPMEPVFSHLPEAAAATACKRRALLLAIELLQALADFSLAAALPELGVEAMQVKIGMAFGRASAVVLGGVCRRFEFVLAGEAANRAAELSETPAPKTAGNGVSFAVVCAEIADAARLELAPGAAHALVLLPSPGDAESAGALQVLREDLLAELPRAGGPGGLFCPYSGVSPSQTLELSTEFRRLRKNMLARSRQREQMSPDEAGDAASPHGHRNTSSVWSDRRSMSTQSSAERQQQEMRPEPEPAEQSESGELAEADATALAVVSRPAQACSSAGPSHSVAYRERDTQFAARSRRQRQFIWSSPEHAREPESVTAPKSPKSPQSQESPDQPEGKRQQEPGLDMFRQLELIGGFIPNVLLKSVASGQAESAFIQSFLSVMFVRVLNVSSSGPLDLDMMKLAATEAMVAIMNNCGDLRQIALDDKGFVVIGLFDNLNNLSGDTPENEAFSAALELRDRFEQLGFRAGIGLASGFARSGMTGTPHRSEFTVVGSAVNLSARLMSLAANAVATGGYSSASSAIFLDEETSAGVDPAWLEEEHVTGVRLRVKGFEKRVQVLFPTSGEKPDEVLRVAIAVGDEEAQASAESLVQSRAAAAKDKRKRHAIQQRARNRSATVAQILHATSEIQNGETINDVLRYLAVMSAASPYVETHVLYRVMESTEHTRGAIEYALKVLCTRFNVLERIAEDNEQYFIRSDESSSSAIKRVSSISALAESAISAQQPPQQPPSPSSPQQPPQPQQQQQQSSVVRSPRTRLLSLYSSLMRAFRTRLHLELAAIYSVGSTGHTVFRAASPILPAAHGEQEGLQQRANTAAAAGSEHQARMDQYEVSGLHYALAGEEQHLTAAHFLNMSLARCDRDDKPRIDTLVSQSRSLVQSWARVQKVKAEKELALCEFLQAEAALEMHRMAEALDGFKRCLAAYTSLADFIFEPIDDAASASALALASASASVLASSSSAAAAAIGPSALITNQRSGSGLERLASQGNGSVRGGSGGAPLGSLSLYGSIELCGGPPPPREYLRTTLVLLVHYLDSAQSFSLQFVAIKLALPGAVYETLPCLARIAPPSGTGTSGCVIKSLRAPEAMAMYSLPGYLKAGQAQFLQVVLPDTTTARQVLTSLFQLGALSDRQQQQGPSVQPPGGVSLRRNSLAPSMGRHSSRERNSIKERLAGPQTSISPAHTPLPERRAENQNGQHSRACALM